MDYKKLYEQTLAENKELKENQLTEESAIDYVYQHTSDYEDWIMGSDVYLKLKEENEELLEINERDRDYCDGERDPIGISQEVKDKIIISLVGERFPQLEKQVAELKEENQKLKDFTNWENHPALRHKVVLDDDYYLELKKE